MAYIKSIEINKFRGIQELSISNFSDINLIVGDNNSGKTTLLEAVQLLFLKPQLGAIKRVISQRTILKANENSFYTSFIKTFNIKESREHLDFSVSAESDNGIFEFELRGKETMISGETALNMSTLSSGQKTQYKRSSAYIPEMAKLFKGSIVTNRGKRPVEKEIQCTSLDSGISSVQMEKEVQYISSFGHLRYDLLQNIVNNPEYKNLTINILKKFDDSIADICYTKADDGAYLETVITKDGENMPFSIYGDGVKKILYILNKMFDAENSILMIDEIETGLHKKYYEFLFPVLFELAKKLNIQLFIATHNIEVIDAILKYGEYDDNNQKSDKIRVITLRKIESKTGSNIIARNIDGKDVYDNRKAFEFEVRL